MVVPVVSVTPQSHRLKHYRRLAAKPPKPGSRVLLPALSWIEQCGVGQSDAAKSSVLWDQKDLQDQPGCFYEHIEKFR